MTYKFYVQMEGQSYGPYTVKELMELPLLDETLLTEESMNGEWLPARRFDFEDMLKKENGTASTSFSSANMQTQSNLQHTYTPPVQDRINPDGTINMSGTPSIIGKWNWGAFWFNWLWGIFNGVYWPLLLILVGLIPFVGWIATLAGCIYLGIKGNELSWNSNKNWPSVEDFEKTQKNWSIAVLWVLGISFILGIIVGIANA